ncbi:MAG: class I SAM-dependent methyltransferase [Solobacterium sp.]|nr:class I SAM-dependent methyltransferase [Solobacterium sp.]
MSIQDVAAYFDGQAASWDARMVRNDKILNIILDTAGIKAGMDVLDIACGTGVLLPDYQKRQVHSVTAIDLSPGMIAQAKKKYPDVCFLVGDAAKADYGQLFDAAVVYNALPHFEDPSELIAHTVRYLKQGGRLTIAHGSSRETVNARHRNSGISQPLMKAEELADIMRAYLTVTDILSNEEMYLVSGYLI